MDLNGVIAYGVAGILIAGFAYGIGCDMRRWWQRRHEAPASEPCEGRVHVRMFDSDGRQQCFEIPRPASPEQHVAEIRSLADARRRRRGSR